MYYEYTLQYEQPHMLGYTYFSLAVIVRLKARHVIKGEASDEEASLGAR